MIVDCVADPKPTGDKFEFIELYKTVCSTVNLIGKGERRRPPALQKNATKSTYKEAIKKGAVYLPFNYQDQYVKPLLDNLDLVIAQSKDSSMLENIIGAVYDQSEGSSVTAKVRQLVAAISNLYRTFLRAPTAAKLKIQLQYLMPPLGTFQYEIKDLDDCTPSTLPVDELRLLFGALVGVVILPDSYQKYPVLWSAIVHEVGGHDLLRAHPGILRDLEDGMERLFWYQRGLPKSMRVFLARLWKYWIGEAAADIAGILNMGPSYALSVALYTAVLNRNVMPLIKKKIEQGRGDLGWWTDQNKEMRTRPILRISPPPPSKYDEKGQVILEDLDTHPSDVLRLCVMKGAILGLKYLHSTVKTEYLNLIDRALEIGLTQENCEPRLGNDKCRILGFLQTGADTWIVEKKEVPINLMRSCAVEVGRFVVTETFDTLTRIDDTKQSVQDIVGWTTKQENVARNIRNQLIESNGEGEGLISNSGDDAQLFAGATLALFQNSSKKFFRNVNDRLAEGLQTSFDRDEVWGYPILARTWSPYLGPLVSSSGAIVK